MVADLSEFPTAWVAQIGKSTFDTNKEQDPFISSAVKVVDYPEIKTALIELLREYRNVWVFPKEPLGVTDKTVHHIKLKPDTVPVYISAYRLPRSERNTVDNMVKDMLEQDVIQELHSPCNSPLFLVPKKDGTFKPVIGFRRDSAVTLDGLPLVSDLLCLWVEWIACFQALIYFPVTGKWNSGLHRGKLRLSVREVVTTSG